MLLYVPVGEQVYTLRLTGDVYLRALRELSASSATGDAARQVTTEIDVGLSLMALGLPVIRDRAWPILADRGGLLAMSGAALDLVLVRMALPDALQFAQLVAAAVLSPHRAPVVEAPVAPAPEPEKPRAFGVRRPPPDPYDGTMVDGETWPEFCLRTDSGRKPGSEAALERWKVIEQEFSARKEG